MDIRFPERLETFEQGIFAALNERKNRLIAEGRTVYNMEFVMAWRIVTVPL